VDLPGSSPLASHAAAPAAVECRGYLADVTAAAAAAAGPSGLRAAPMAGVSPAPPAALAAAGGPGGMQAGEASDFLQLQVGFMHRAVAPLCI
jgi:hypothetical protein